MDQLSSRNSDYLIVRFSISHVGNLSVFVVYDYSFNNLEDYDYRFKINYWNGVRLYGNSFDDVACSYNEVYVIPFSDRNYYLHIFNISVDKVQVQFTYFRDFYIDNVTVIVYLDIRGWRFINFFCLCLSGIHRDSNFNVLFNSARFVLYDYSFEDCFFHNIWN